MSDKKHHKGHDHEGHEKPEPDFGTFDDGDDSGGGGTKNPPPPNDPTPIG